MCGVCGKPSTYLCKKCEKKLSSYLFFKKDEYIEKYFTNHFYLFRYEGVIRNLILNYKFNEKPYLYKTLLSFLKKCEKEYLQIDFYDIIVPVPISKKRKLERGYNQSDLVAKELANFLNLNLESHILLKNKNNKVQSSLDKIEREENVKGVYILKKINNIIDKNVLLVDDIFTTGATLNECSKILKEAGASQVDVFTIAKD